MGTIYYGGEATPIDVEDLALAHLKVVIATKLRRGESFTVSWQHPDGQPRGRSTIWLHPSIPLRFVFEDPNPAVLNRAWLEELATSANSTGGISLIADHFENPTEPVPAQSGPEAHQPATAVAGPPAAVQAKTASPTASTATRGKVNAKR